MYEKANSVVIESVHAPHWLHRFIIGRKGQNVQKITQDLPKVGGEEGREREGKERWYTLSTCGGIPSLYMPYKRRGVVGRGFKVPSQKVVVLVILWMFSTELVPFFFPVFKILL